MAGLYDGLPEPSGAGSMVAGDGLTSIENISSTVTAKKTRVRPCIATAAPIFIMDDASVHVMFAFLALPDIGSSLPVTCRVLRWLRDTWLLWQQFLAPLQRRHINVTRLSRSRLESIQELGSLTAAVGSMAEHGFRGERCGHSWRGVDGFAYNYGELPVPRVMWSLHTEGFTPWKNVCSMAVDAGFALLPPWSGARRLLLPSRIQVQLGISLWLPPQYGDPEYSFPALHLNAALDEPEKFEAIAARYPNEPPVLAAVCDAMLFRPGSSTAIGATVVEEWGFRVCFGPRGYRHPGHGETDGYFSEVNVVGRRRWRPPELCHVPDGQRPQDLALHILSRGKHCEGLLD